MFDKFSVLPKDPLDWSQLANYGTGVPSTPVTPLPGLGTSAVSGSVPSPVDGDWASFSNMLGGTDAQGNKTNGLIPTGLGVAKGIADSWLAMQQLDLAKDSFSFQKDAFNKQYENQRTLTNSRLEDRQHARLSANPDGYQSVGDYMNKHGV